MVTIDSDNIDFKALIDDVEQAIEADRIYSLRNDAKIRAINQRGTTYEDFENMVKGATLKPFDKKEKIFCNPKQTWNSIAREKEGDLRSKTID